MNSILIVGAGQLGSRYLQGLAKLHLTLDIIVYDISENSLKLAESRWLEVSSIRSIHQIQFVNNLDFNIKKFDIVIIATSSSVRQSLVKKISNNFDVKFWILEKVLAQSVEEINEISDCIKGAKGAWVNTPRRVMGWWKMLKESINPNTPLEISIRGGSWGLACNSIHFLDIVHWITGEKLIKVQTDLLETQWYESKRNGYYEVFGSINCLFSEGTVVELTVDRTDSIIQIDIENNKKSWSINEKKGIAYNSDGNKINGNIELQSEITTTVIENILLTGNCDLPSLESSSILHKPFISSMLEHWKKQINKKYDDRLPIT
jgi:hypothetical protein